VERWSITAVRWPFARSYRRGALSSLRFSSIRAGQHSSRQPSKRRGLLQEALAIREKLRTGEPELADCLHMLGIIMNVRGDE
jgi:hypothetical protein